MAPVHGWTVGACRRTDDGAEGMCEAHESAGVAFLLVTFLWPRKEKSLAPARRAGETLRGHSPRLEAEADSPRHRDECRVYSPPVHCAGADCTLRLSPRPAGQAKPLRGRSPRLEAEADSPRHRDECPCGNAASTFPVALRPTALAPARRAGETPSRTQSSPQGRSRFAKTSGSMPPGDKVP